MSVIIVTHIRNHRVIRTNGLDLAMEVFSTTSLGGVGLSDLLHECLFVGCN